MHKSQKISNITKIRAYYLAQIHAKINFECFFVLSPQISSTMTGLQCGKVRHYIFKASPQCGVKQEEFKTQNVYISCIHMK